MSVYAASNGDYLLYDHKNEMVVEPLRGVALERSAVNPGTAVGRTNNTLWINSVDGHAYRGPVDLEGGAGADVSGPASSTDNAIARFDGTTGKLIQNSIPLVDDTGNLSLVRSTTFTPVAANPGGVNTLWIRSVDGKVYKNGVDLEKQGDVVGPVIATDEDIAVFDGTSGKLVKLGGVSLSAGTLVMTFPALEVGGIKLPSFGGTQTTLNYYEEHTLETIWEAADGPWTADQRVSITFVRIGKHVTMFIPEVVAAGTDTERPILSSKTAIPDRFLPASNVWQPIRVTNTDGSWQATPGMISIDPSLRNPISIHPDMKTGLKWVGDAIGFDQIHLSYLTA